MSAIAAEGSGDSSDRGHRSRRVERAWQALGTVLDPEVPALSICDLGIVRGIVAAGDELWVALTPTYSGCPATEMIERLVVEAIDAAALGPVRIQLQRAPAWTSDWISAAGRSKLRAAGIAPPHAAAGAEGVPLRFTPRLAEATVNCPLCGSRYTERLSAFGSTACKALYRCVDCREPFDYFKPF